jgi:hypothetical protein
MIASVHATSAVPLQVGKHAIAAFVPEVLERGVKMSIIVERCHVESLENVVGGENRLRFVARTRI